MKTVETIPVVIGCTLTVDKRFVDYVDKFPAQLCYKFGLMLADRLNKQTKSGHLELIN